VAIAQRRRNIELTAPDRAGARKLTVTGSERAGVILDDAGRAWPSHPLSLARQLGCPTGDFDVIAHAVRHFGYVHVAPIRDAVLVKFDPATVHHLAAIAAFYEIAGRAPKRLILACPGERGSPDRYEIFNSLNEGLRRLEAAAETCHTSVAPASTAPAAAPARRNRSKEPRRPAKRKAEIVSLWRPDRLAVRRPSGDSSKRLCLPLDAISREDEWLARLLGMWRAARVGWRLPASESLNPLGALRIARGWAHIVETRDANPAGYRFRLWGSAINPYVLGDSNLTLGQMPRGLMREDAIEDYWEVVSTGVPNYQLIRHFQDDRVLPYARLILPLAADGRKVDQLLVLINGRRLRELEPV
jgi:hypothetical protein